MNIDSKNVGPSSFGDGLDWVDWEGDSINNTAVWVPSIGSLCATDIAFDDWNVWFFESNVERRVKWRAAINRLREFGARVIIPGHGSEKTKAILENASRDTSAIYTSCLDFTLEYINFYDEEVYGKARTGAEIASLITEKYPQCYG